MIGFAFLLLAQATASLSVASDQSHTALTFEQAITALAKVKTSIEWNEKERRYSCSVKQASEFVWLDAVPCAALAKCEKGKSQNSDELVPCFNKEAVGLVLQALAKQRATDAPNH